MACAFILGLMLAGALRAVILVRACEADVSRLLPWMLEGVGNGLLPGKAQSNIVYFVGH